ncbi:Intersectin 1 (SH3 domain protein) [Coemansia sp. RSA 1200]|nr:Intersectin 1 (SH3 domain protein) [Coemansia sp. RSA 1200]
MYAKAIYACVADNSSEVTFDADDILVSIEESGEDGWLQGRVERTGDFGLFPAVYAELHPQSGDDLAFLRRLQAQGLLSSTLELEAFRRGLDSGLVRPMVSAKPAGLTATVSAKRSATSTAASTVSTGAYVSTATTSSSYAESIESSVSATSGFGATSAARPQTAQHQLYSQQPPRVTHTPVAAPKPPPALPPKSAKPNLGATASSAADGAEAEQARQREADAARAWEEAHLAKKPTTLSGSREVARMVSGSSSPASRLQQSQAKYERQKQSSRPEVPLKPVAIRSAAGVGDGAGRKREEEEEQRRRDKEREEADLWEARHGIGAKSSASASRTPPQSARVLNGNSSTMHSVPVGRRAPPAVPAKPPLASKPAVAVPGKPASFSPPVVPPKPAVAASRSASANIGARSTTRQNTCSSERSSSYTAAMAPSDPSVIPEAPALPYNAFRSAIRERIEAREREEMAYIGNASAVPESPALPHNAARTAMRERIEAREREEMAYVGNASVIAEPPALPSRHNSRTASEPLSLIENTMQPSPKHLISRINSVSGASNSNGFEDSFDPFKIMKQQTAGPGALNTSIRSPPSTTTIGNMATTTSPGAIESSPANSGFNRATTTHTYHASSSYNSSITTTSAGSMDAMSTIPDDALSRYAHLFNKLNKQFGKRGYLTASEVRAVVAKSRLPDDQMRHILALSDRNMDGRFGPGEFNLIMHLADSALRHDPIPDAVPVDLLHAAYAR